MDLRPTAEQEQLIDAFQRMLAKAVPSDAVRAAEPTGFDAVLWAGLAEIGAVPMGVPVEAGGWGASLLDLSLVGEQLGRVLAPAPFVETAVSARLLARLGGAAAAAALNRVLNDEKMITISVRSSQHGRAALVPAGAVADAAIVLHDESLLLVDARACGTPVTSFGALPLADLAVTPDAVVLAEGPDAVAAFDAAVDEWLALTASALVGLAARALEIGVEYGRERLAWGRPIGSYQGVSHPLADCATAVDGARLLAHKAAWAAAIPGGASELAAMAFAFASEVARDVTYQSLHFHGGYGFMLEYDIQLYFRRARAWSNVYAEPARAYDRVAEKRFGGSHVRLRFRAVIARADVLAGLVEQRRS